MLHGRASRPGALRAQHTQDQPCSSTHLHGLLRLVVDRLGDGLQAGPRAGSSSQGFEWGSCNGQVTGTHKSQQAPT